MSLATGASPGPVRRSIVRRGSRSLRQQSEWLIERFLQLNGFLAIFIIGAIFYFLFSQGYHAFYEVWVPTNPDIAQQDNSYGKRHAAALEAGDTVVLLKPAVEPSEFLGEEVTLQEFNTETQEFTESRSYERMWQPNSSNPKFSVLPLLVGSLIVALPATLMAMILGLGVAIYLSEAAPPRVRETVKPAIELLAGIPTVVLGFLLLMVVATPLKELLNLENRLNGFVGAIGVALVIIPVVATIAEDALRAVPAHIRQGSMALGATRWQTVFRAVLPAAISGIMAAVMLGFGRALGETMIVLMATGNAAVMTANPFTSVRTMTATIAAELGAVDQGGNWWYALFLVGTLLFTLTFIFNAVAEYTVQRMRRQLIGTGDL